MVNASSDGVTASSGDLNLREAPRVNVRRRRLGQANNEAAAAVRHVFRGDRTAVRRGDAPGDSQAQPDTRVAELAGRLGAIKRLEDVREVFG